MRLPPPRASTTSGGTGIPVAVLPLSTTADSNLMVGIIPHPGITIGQLGSRTRPTWASTVLSTVTWPIASVLATPEPAHRCGAGDLLALAATRPRTGRTAPARDPQPRRARMGRRACGRTVDQLAGPPAQAPVPPRRPDRPDHGRRPADSPRRQLPREPAQHLHRSADRRDARRGAGRAPRRPKLNPTREGSWTRSLTRMASDEPREAPRVGTSLGALNLVSPARPSRRVGRGPGSRSSGWPAGIRRPVQQSVRDRPPPKSQSNNR